jgi:hypothetical protein
MEEERSRFGIRNLGAAAALGAYAFFAAAYGPDGSFPGSDFGSLAYGLSRQGLWFLPVGILIPLVLPRMRGVVTGFFVVLLPSLALGAVLTALVIAAPDAAPWRVLDGFVVPDVMALLAPLTGMFVGALFGAVIARGLGSALVLIPALFAIAAILLASVAVLLLMLTDRVAVTDPIGPPGSPEGQYRDAFADFYRDGAPGSHATLNAETFAAGMRMALAAIGVDPGVRLHAAPVGDSMEVAGSVPVSVPLFGARFLNVVATARPTVQDGVFRAAFRSVEVGGIAVPATVVRVSSRVLSRWLRRTSVVAALLAPFDEVHVEESRIVVRWREGTDATADHSRVGGYLTLLARDADLLREQPDRTSAVLRRTFALAAVRSVGGDAVAENRAALLALGGAFGHPALLDLARIPGGGEEARGLLERLPLSLHGRRDWARHFFLSAGIVQVAPDGVSGGAGLLKEQLDAAAGGTGFSFTDLLMDEAGTRFGTAATGDPARARWIQVRLANGVREEDLAPPDAGLPEGLSAARLEDEFGGVRGEGFRDVEAEIARRVDALPLYRTELPRVPPGIAPPSGTLPGTP